ncbi:MAG: hotdog fold thioesterase [Flavobacteriales bacterium]|nr:hotdog fold thioesterase [Flavobacteriales bacterium]MDG2246911.1 hotdog fold thioesterase [Flavobacteriales bacterium]
MNREMLDKMGQNTLGESLGIDIQKVEDGYVEGTMPVDHRTHQPYGLLHGGASVALAETLGSVGSHFLVADQGKGAVGIEINANHVKGKRDGVVTGKAKIVHRGGKLHIWSIDIVDEQDKLICTSRLTVMIVPAK